MIIDSNCSRENDHLYAPLVGDPPQINWWFLLAIKLQVNNYALIIFALR